MTTIHPPNTTPRPAVRPQAVLARDWLKTLWPASYKGVPFKVEMDREEGSRRIVEHEFPMRDDPFLEDLGEGVRHYRCTAYVASDSADGDAAAVMAVCATRGPGALVLPAHGPIIVRCLSFERSRSKDRHGYIGLELRFAREGFGSALASIASLANLVFVQCETASLAVARAFVSSASLTRQPDYVVAAATERVQDAVSVLEAVRTSQSVDPVASAEQRNVIQSLFDQAPALMETPETAATLAQGVVSVARALGDAMPAASALTTFEAIITDASLAPLVANVGHPTENQRNAIANANAAYQLLRLSALVAYVEATARVKFTDRPSAVTTRANVADYFSQQTDDLPAGNIDLVHSLGVLRDKAVDYLSRAIIDAAPVVRVEANLSLPSLYWSWRLYADPARSTELVERNRLPHPSFFPLTFEALAR